MAKAAKIGQNFLHDKNIASKIIDVFLPQAPGPVLEIGAGPGILSGLLLEKIPPERITLVEIDPFLARELRERFGARTQVLEKDILETDLAGLYPEGQVAIIGNLPYYISKELLDWFIAQRARIGAAVVMLQRDFVDKLLSAENQKKYNAQSIVFQTFFQTRRCFNVPAGAFQPAPKVTSTVLAIRPNLSPFLPAAAEFYPFVRLCFGERRKTLLNNLAPHFEKQELAAAAGACGIPDRARAEQLPAERFAALFAALKKSAPDRRP
ncbi:MAG: 16S rRNA (adenine(1518)-N(6)/adenine(1519)-N(6))-dimethyltransferase RsmA [Candidatus Aminicenantes bacterium]|nr:16S rRNA (adenine(1518)-N(6)/adenine(1519)-N(6))-dimethyltransferase RsmA [Candidatus Aminicenantes bacterium]